MFAGSTVSEVRPIADAIRESKGGLKGVQAMALKNGDVIEVACNLLDADTSGPEEVRSAVSKHCETFGVKMGKPYIISLLPHQILAKTKSELGLD